MDLPTSQPPTAPPLTTKVPSSKTSDIKAAIAEVYTDFWPVSAEAAKAPAAQARKLLAPYVAGEFLDEQVQKIGTYQAENQEPYGQPTVHIMRVTLGPGNTASLHDCLDFSKAGLADRRTHQLIPGTLGSSRTHVAADFKRGSDGRWRLTSVMQLEEPCSPASSQQ
ncbi:hypothetical protein OHA25_08210 [Nonomuraea sp. NBC_00507]|uniref:hypothetical protein n=1 Tax=Nonomuraea sp. NBC_00507 TaxID=2976002 RepID=UPI002E188577